MKPEPNERALDRALADLPNVAASRDFEHRVVARLRARRRRRAIGWTGAAVAAVAAVLWITPLGVAPTPDARTADRIDEHTATRLRQTHADLAREVGRLRTLAAERPTVLYLGSNERYDFVLDLSELSDRGARGRDPEQPRSTVRVAP